MSRGLDKRKKSLAAMAFSSLRQISLIGFVVGDGDEKNFSFMLDLSFA